MRPRGGASRGGGKRGRPGAGRGGARAGARTGAAAPTRPLDERELEELGRVREYEDEEISEDGAFDSEDERQYGDLLGGKRDAASGDEDDEEQEAEGDEQGETLLDMIKGSEDAEVEASEASSEEGAGGAAGSDASSGSDESDSDSESDSGSDSDSGSSDASTGGLDVSALVDKLVAEDSAKQRAKEAVISSNRATAGDEGEFRAQALRPGTQLTMEQLMGSLSARPEQLSALKKRLGQLDDSKRVSERAPRVVEERAARRVGYDQARKEGGAKWSAEVAKLRDAPHLQFPLVEPARNKSTSGAVAAAFEAENDLETEVEAALESAGLLDEAAVRAGEERHLLEVNHVDPETVKERQGQLAKLRALMFYEEQKARRSNKIKSKLYRKLKKKREAREDDKALAALKEVDPAAAKALEDKAEYDRAKERMSLRHKNTSKFIRGLLKNGGMQRDGSRDAINEQLEEEQRLKKRMRTLGDEEEDEDADDEEQDDPRAALERLVAGIKADKSTAAVEAPKTKGLLGLKFMQRGAERQREQAQARAEALLDAVDAGEEDLDAAEGRLAAPSDVAVVGRRKLGPVAKARAAAAEPGAGQEGVDAYNGAHLHDDPAALAPHLVAQTSGFVAVTDKRSGEKQQQQQQQQQQQRGGLFEAPAFPEAPKPKPTRAGAARPAKTVAPSAAASAPAATKAGGGAGAGAAAAISSVVAASASAGGSSATRAASTTLPAAPGDASNPWLSASAQQAATLKKRARTDGRKVRFDESAVQVDTAQSTLDDEAQPQEQARKKAKGGDGADKESEEALNRKEQAKLIRRAFAGAGAMEQDFQDSKAKEEQTKEETKQDKEKKMFDLPGWGSWAGDAVAEARRAAKLRRAAAQAPAVSQAKAKRAITAGPKHVVLNEKRNKKAAKYLVDKVPYPFTSREQYEQSLRNPLGSDWNTLTTFAKAIKPAVITKQGAIIDPLEAPTHARAE